MRQLMVLARRRIAALGRWAVMDWLVAAGCAVPAALVLVNEATGSVRLAAVPLLLAAVIAPMALRRRWPVSAVLIEVTAVAVVGLVEPRAVLVGLVALGYVLYAAAAAPPLVALGLLATALLAATATALPDFRHPGGAVVFAIVYLSAWSIGFWVATQRRQSAAELADQARLAEAELARAHGVLTQERLRIARELHDVVAHSITVITVHAAFGRLVADDAAQAKDVLGTIETAGRETLVELRQLLQVLRASGPDAIDESGPSLDPAPGLADLDQLVSRSAAAGLRLEVRVVGVPRVLPLGIDTSAYRVIQEATTNVVKHAGVATATAVLCFDEESLEIQVSDAGRRCPGEPLAGYGLIGMRERLHLFGGSFSAGPLPGGGFRVTGRFPLERVAADRLVVGGAVP
jgi:signal transduction histidine kinase